MKGETIIGVAIFAGWYEPTRWINCYRELIILASKMCRKLYAIYYQGDAWVRHEICSLFRPLHLYSMILVIPTCKT